jgi:hypothetical protein
MSSPNALKEFKSDIVSRELLEAADQGKVQIGIENASANIRTWENFIANDIETNALIFDSDMQNYPSVPPSFSDSLLSFLNGGGIVIGLTSRSTATPIGKIVDDFGIGELVPSAKNRTDIKVFPRHPSVTRYFELLDHYECSIRLSESIISSPDILAENMLDGELVAVGINEVEISSGSMNLDGQIILLPRISMEIAEPSDLVTTLLEIARYYHELTPKFLTGHDEDDILLEPEYVLDRGESEVIEFKRGLPDSVDKIVQECAAFSNRRGGVLVLGVDDEGAVFGVDDIDELEERVTEMIRQNTQPRIFPRVSKQTIDDKDVLFIRVYNDGNIRSIDGRFYIRVGTTTQRLTGNELESRLGF